MFTYHQSCRKTVTAPGVSTYYQISRESTHASHALIEPMYPLEDNRIKGQKEVEYAIHKGHVYADSQYDRLR